MHCSSRKVRFYLVNAHCDVEEDNEEKREHYHYTWLDLVMQTRPEQKISLFEEDTSRKESYEQKQEANFLVKRHPDQRILLGRQGGKMAEYLLPCKNVLPVPIFTPGKAASHRNSDRALGHSELKSVMEYDSTCLEKTEVSRITKDIPKVVQPARVAYRVSNLISPPRKSSHSPQRCQ
ncbi:telethonin isoform X1 [Conger conger]|uniref:telethonin isoform X1 n=1 Tax=Conger conger TaxID=82655 RepID=UPI002A5A05A9|nr:telethonin isoform X1 [Conger conger]